VVDEVGIKGSVFFFLKKKEAKRLYPLARVLERLARVQENESFLVLFFKKEHSCLALAK
jgi:hypothetical protein